MRDMPESRSIFENDTNGQVTGSGRKYVQLLFKSGKLVAPDFKKTVDDLTSTYKKSCDEFKKYVDENIRRMVNFPSANTKSQTGTKKQK